MSSTLEEAIELSKDCCDKKDLITYGTEHDHTCGGVNQTFLVCTNCRTNYSWYWDDPIAKKWDWKMSDEDIYQGIENHISSWSITKDNDPKGYERFISIFAKKLNLDRSKIEKIIRKFEIRLEYGYEIEDEKDLETEGVTLVYAIKSDEFSVYKFESLENFESIVNKLIQPYKLIAETCRKTKLQNKLFFEPPFSDGERLAININGPACEIKDILERLINSYGLPYAIYKPNALFKDSDTEKGTDITKDICIKMGGKIKKPSLLESKLFYKNEKYVISKKKLDKGGNKLWNN